MSCLNIVSNFAEFEALVACCGLKALGWKSFRDDIFGFKCTIVEGREVVTYDEIPLNPYTQTPITLCEMKSDEYIEYREIERCNYYWHKNACYVLARMYTFGTPVYKFDLETRRITCILESIHDLSVKDFRVDDDEILSVCSEFSHKKQHILHRFSFRQPEKLTLLSLMSIQKKILTFTTEKEYNAVISKLPAEVRPFTNSLSLQ
ncbi:hypothetical protein M3Y97_01057400 [Aphelenchoides bicaudatus]|nr:hypothetical protein M3Y97_01057400 [Aphelenchoides bicaudatus]